MRFLASFQVFSFLFVLFCPSFTLASDDCSSRLQLFKKSISQEAYLALEDAVDSGHYEAQIYEREGRYVVLVGESHDKEREAAQLGKTLIVEFQFRGYEGFDHKKTVGGILASSFPWLKPRELPWEGSTIDEIKFDQAWVEREGDEDTFSIRKTYFDDATITALVNMADRLKSASKDYELYLQNVVEKFQLRELSQNELEELKLNIEFKDPTGALFIHGTIRAADLLARIDKIQNKKNHGTTSAEEKKNVNTKYKAIWLEEGHKPDWREHVFSLFWKTRLGYDLFSFYHEKKMEFMRLIAVPIFVSSFFVPEILQLPLLLPSGLVLSTKVLQDLSMNSKWGALMARDKTMVKNIVKALNDHPNEKVFLNVVGKLHLRGMGRLLRSQGFKDIKFN